MTSSFLGTDPLYVEIRNEIEDMAHYLEQDTLRRQANTVVRLTVVTVFGLIGTVVTGIFGMNILDFPGFPLPLQLVLLVCTIVGVAALLFYTLAKSKGLADFLDAVSDERLGTSDKVRSFFNVWRNKRTKSASASAVDRPTLS
jgi:hypothetical protein